MRLEPRFGRVMVPALVTVWSVSTPPIWRVAPRLTETAETSAMRSSPVVARVPAEIVVAPV